MWFASQIETVEPEIQQTPLEQLEELRQARREAKAAYDNAWKHLQEFLQVNPPERRPFSLNKKVYVPVNLLQSIPAKQRELENQVARSKARWSGLQKQEADLLLRLGIIK